MTSEQLSVSWRVAYLCITSMACHLTLIMMTIALLSALCANARSDVPARSAAFAPTSGLANALICNVIR